MRILNHLSIARKIALLAGGSLVALVLALLFSGAQIRTLQSTIIELDTNRLPSVQHIYGMRASLADYRVYEYRHALTTQEQQLSEVEALLASERARFISHEQSYKAILSLPEERRIYEDYKHLEEQYLATHEQAMGLSRKNQKAEAFEVLRGAGKRQYDSCRALLQSLIALNVAVGEEARAKSAVAIRNAFGVILVFAGVLVIVFLGLYLLFRQLIVRPLQGLRLAMKEATKGNLGVTVRNEARDEIGSLTRSYNRMIEQIASAHEEIQMQNEEITRQQRILEVQSQYLERANASLRQNNTDLREFMQREFMRIEELTRHKDILVEFSKRDELHNGNLQAAFEAITECGAVQLDVPRVSVWLIRKRSFLGSRETVALELRDLYDAIAGAHETDKRLVMDDYPVYFHALHTQDVIAADDASTNEYTKEFAETYLRPLGIGAMLDVPIRAGQALVGVICAEHIGSSRRWTLDEQIFLRTLATFVTVALDAAEKNEQRTLLAELNHELLLVNTELQEKNIALQQAQAIAIEALNFINEQNMLLEEKTAALADMNGELQEKNGMLADSTNVLADAYQQIRKQNELLERTTVEKVVRLSSLEGKNAVLQQTYEDLSEAYSEIKRQNELLEQQARQAASMSHLMNDQNARLQDANSELAKTYAEIRRQNDLLQEQARAIEEANTQLQEKNLALVQADKEKNEMLGIVAHDLRNPLASILLASSIVQRSIERTGDCPPVELNRYMGRISETAERMNSIITELLDLNAIETGNMRIAHNDIDLVALASVVHEDFSKRAEDKNIAFSIFVPDKRVRTLTDGRLLRQVLENIVSNAIKYSPLGKSVMLRLEELVHEDTLIARFTVRDEGPGINTTDRTHLFKKFTRLSAKPTAGEHSTGLGLSIVKRFAEALGGKVHCESSPETGQIGAAFIVELPIIIGSPS